MRLNTFSDPKMLAAGKSEWMVSAGLGSYLRDDERTYQPGEHLANAVYRLGVTDTLSAETQVKGDDRAVEAGMGLLAATAWGAIGVNTALSASDLGKGAASNVSWDLVNVRGLLGTWVGTRESLRLAAEYRSTWFRSPGGSLISSNGILYPETPYWLRLSGAYSIPINPTTTASLSARYQFADPQQPTYTPFRIDGDRYGADLTLSTRLSTRLSTSFTAGYSNEITQRAFDNTKADIAPEARFMVRVFVLPFEGSRVSASYDSSTGRPRPRPSRAILTASSGGKPTSTRKWTTGPSRRWRKARCSTPAIAERCGSRRAQAWMTWGDASQRAGKRPQLRPFRHGHRLRRRPGGHGAAGARQRLCHRLSARQSCGQGHHRGRSGKPASLANGLGPALITDLPAYVPNNIPVDVKDLPPGYSLGNGTFDVVPPYRGATRSRSAPPIPSPPTAPCCAPTVSR